MTDPLHRLADALSDRYLIERELGQGGMATVYLARDLKHNRPVALKVLKPELAAVVGAERFLAEIETTANLQHPHILPLFDSGAADGFLFYVMPYVEGETLRDRLDRERQLPVDDAVRIVVNVAEALEHAHAHGVVHRDIKPANILLRDGKPMVADFGIALAVGTAGEGRLTETGLSMGTPYYMSPEQATGEPNLGPTADTYALGCVLYEMLAGAPPFTGSTAQSVLGKIITEPAPRVSRERSTVPAHVDATVARALEKVPADRFTRAADMARALSNPAFRYGSGIDDGATGGGAAWRRRTQAVGAVAMLAIVLAAWGWLRPAPDTPVRPEARFESPFRPDQAPAGRTFSVFSDGSGIVYPGFGPERGAPLLRVRRWSDPDAQLVSGTDGVRHPGVSPDGQEVVYLTGNPGAIRVTPLGGGEGRTIVPSAYGPIAWSDDGWIYHRTEDNRIGRVRPGGGEPQVLTELDEGEALHALPHPLPGGRYLLFAASRDLSGSGAHIQVLDLSTSERRVLRSGHTPRFAPPDHLLFGTDGGTLMAAPFDAERAIVTGDATVLLEGVQMDLDFVYLSYDVADDGSLVYWRDGALSEMEFVWVSRAGDVQPLADGQRFSVNSRGNLGWRLSPDGERIAFRRTVDGNDDIWIQDVSSGATSRLTTGDEPEMVPTWSGDGTSIVYRMGPVGQGEVWSIPVDGSGSAEKLFDDFNVSKALWSPDGEWLVIRRAGLVGQERARDILAIRPGVDTMAIPLMADPDFWEQAPALSPDGRWIAYSSNETGRHEIFVRPFPNVDQGKSRVSTDGGVSPVWSRDGSTIFFGGLGSRSIMAAEIDPAARVFEVRSVSPVVEVPEDMQFSASGNMDFFDITPDGERFLMARVVNPAEGVPTLVLVQNFVQRLAERVYE